MRNNFILFFIFLFLGFSKAEAANAPKLAKTPAWASQLELPLSISVNERKIVDGYYYLISSSQMNVATEEIYVNYAIKVQNKAGIQNTSEISINYDPAYQSAVFHFVHVIRGKEKLNKYNQKEVKVIQREDNLESKIYDGSLTAHLSLADIRVGDIIEYAYTIKGRNPVFKGKFFTSLDMAYSAPVSLIYNKIVAPTNRKLNYKTIGEGSFKPNISSNNGFTSYEWQVNCNNPLDAEENVPSHYNPYPFIDVTEYNSWEEVVNWAIPLYNENKPLAKKLKDKTSELTKDKLAVEEQIVAVFRFIQNEVRYMGFEVGVNSHKPHSPNLVFENRFGDCKDKAYLFCSMLKEIGVKAYPNLVNTYFKANVKNELPSPWHFNHVTVCVELNGNSFYLDPTGSHQGGTLRTIQYPDYGYTLLIKPGTKGLTSIKNSNALKRTTLKEIFTYKSLTAPVELVVTTRYEGVDADDARYRFETNSEADIEKEYIDYYTNLYKTVNIIGNINTKDDLENNVFATYERYDLPDILITETGQKKLQIFPDALLGNINIPKTTKRKYPYKLVSPYEYIQQIIIKHPGDWFTVKERKNINNSCFGYFFNSQNGEEPNSFELVYGFKTLKEEVSVEEMNGYTKDLEEVKKYNLFEVTIPDATTLTTPESRSSAVMAVIALVVASLCAFFANKLYSYDERPHYPNYGNPIGGWLLLSAIGLILAPILNIIAFYKADYFNISILDFISNPLAPIYNPLMAAFLLFEMIFFIVIISFQILILILFTQRRSTVPKFVVLCYILLLGLGFWEIVFLNLFVPNPTDNPMVKQAYYTLGGTAISAIIWIPYYLKSVRVKETFVTTYYMENELTDETLNLPEREESSNDKGSEGN